MSRNLGWAIVTGASAGLGAEFAKKLAARGHDLILVARRRDRLDQLAAELTRSHACKVHVLELDLGQAGAAARILAALEEWAIVPTLLVNNAGFGVQGAAIDVPLARTTQMLELNVVSLTELAILIGGKMAAAGHGAIVNIASMGAFQPTPFVAAYGATKAYVLNFSLALRYELAKKGVHVLCVCPGATRTEFFEVSGVRLNGGDLLFMSAERCVALSLRALDRRRAVLVPGIINAIAAFFSRRLPLWLGAWASAKTMK